VTNYKPQQQFINYGGARHLLPAGAKILALYIESGLTTTGVSMHRHLDKNIYVVASGNSFQCVGTKYYSGGATRNITIEQSDADDASTNPVTLCVFGTFFKVSDVPQEIYIGDSTACLAGKRVNVKVSNVTTPPVLNYLIGYEYPV